MYLAYKYRAYPTNDQKLLLAKSFGCVRWYFNYALDLCQKTYKETGKGLTRNKIQSLLPELKKQYSWLKDDVYSQCLQVVALNLTTAYKNFFEGRAKYPRFKSLHGRQSISYPQNVKLDGDYLVFPKLGKLYCRIDRKFEGSIKTVTISKNPDDTYFVSVLVDEGKPEPESNTEGKAIGLDLGLIDFCVTSDGSKYKNPKHFDPHHKNLKRKQQKLARKKIGSNRRNKAKLKVAKIHSKISRCRSDFLHKLSRKIVNENQVIVCENLNVRGMVKNHKLALSISDVGWGMFQTMLCYKAKRGGKMYLEVGRFFPSSKTCNNCLYQIGELPLDIRQWTCPKCNTKHDRDICAARNIRDEGLRILSGGTLDTASGGDVRRLGRPQKLSSAVPETSSIQVVD